MKKSQGRAQLANAARAAGLTLRFSSVGGAEKVTALNASKIVVSTCSIRSTGESYNTQDVVSATKVLNSSRGRKKSLRCAAGSDIDYDKYTTKSANTLARNLGYERSEFPAFKEMLVNGEKEIGGKFVGITPDEDYYVFKLSDGTIALYEEIDGRWYEAEDIDLDSSRKKLNCSEDTDLEGDDADFVEDVDNVVVDEEGNAVEVDAMLIVQDPETNEISLFIPDNESDDVPESLNIIGEVISADTVDLGSSKKKSRKLMNSSKLNASSSTLDSLMQQLGNEGIDFVAADAIYIELGDGSYIYVSEDDDGGYYVIGPETAPAHAYTAQELVDMIGKTWN